MIKTKFFGKSSLSLAKPYLLKTQKDSWDQFWKKDIKELFDEVSPIRDYTDEKFEIRFLDYKLGEPNYSTDLEAKQNNDSYEAPLRARIRLTNLRTKETNEQEVFLTDFPLMTERGTFIVNGVERVIISQIIRSPGAFFTAKSNRGRNYYGAKLIPNRGTWLEFETDISGVLGVKINRKRKVPATTFLRALGYVSNEQITNLFKDVDTGEKRYIEETLKRDPSHSQDDAVIEVYQRLRPGDRATSETARELFQNMFFNFKRYDLSKVGRWRINQRLSELKDKKSATKQTKEDQEITVEDRLLKAQDVIAVIREVIRLNNNPNAKPDFIDHLGNRRLRTISELLKNRLRVGLMRMERIIKDRMSTLDIYTMTPVQIINPRPFMAIVTQFFSSFQLSQFMDNENPLAELEHKRRLSSTGPGGLTRERAGFEVRDVQPSHYGRICPIQTPEGPNIGLVGHLAGYSRVNALGFLETPYFQVKNGKVTSEIKYLNAYEEEKFHIASGSIPVNKDGRILPDRVEGRLNGKPTMLDRSEIEYIDVAPEQPISIGTSCIPFLQNDDANRALMGSNMQRQAVPLVNPQAPFVMTGTEERVARDSGQEIICQEDGIVVNSDGGQIEVKGDKGIKKYPLRTFIRTNQYTCFHQRPLVEKGQKVKKGDVLTSGGAIDQGQLALGRNLLVAFMSWRGRTFEDAIIISENLVKQDAYTSIHLENFGCDVRETKLGPEITTSDIPNVSEEKLRNLDEEGIIRIGAEVGPNDILVGKISPKGKEDLTAEERLLKAIFGEKSKDVKDTSLVIEHGKRGRVVGIKVFSRELGHNLDAGIIKRIEVEIAELRKVQAGDKLCGRHGNKGIVAVILPEEEMPFMEDGTPVDIVLNPLSVASRMNLGQILETHLGWAASKLGYHAITPSLSGANEEDIKEELKKAGLPEDGKITLYDGQTGMSFSQKITVGYIYMLKLIHMVEDKIHMRSIGPYSLITQQPLGGKAQFGGQRFGEMEVWALEGYGAAHCLQEMLTIKSDDIPGRAATYEAILKGEPIRPPNLPASFYLLVNELKALGINVEIKGKHQEE
jgi:DNA-directed RNA polymerase subunit beta